MPVPQVRCHACLHVQLCVTLTAPPPLPSSRSTTDPTPPPPPPGPPASPTAVSGWSTCRPVRAWWPTACRTASMRRRSTRLQPWGARSTWRSRPLCTHADRQAGRQAAARTSSLHFGLADRQQAGARVTLTGSRQGLVSRPQPWAEHGLCRQAVQAGAEQVFCVSARHG